jgi:hypothetical protein
VAGRRAAAVVAVAVAAVVAAACGGSGTGSSGDGGIRVGSANLLDDGIAGAIAAWKDAIGPSIQAVDVTVYPDYAILEARDPDVPRHVDRWHYERDGDLLDPDPVSMTDEEENALDLEAFPLDSVSWDVLPALVDEALVATDVEDPTSTYVTANRDRPATEAVRLWVYVSGERSSGWLVADARGNVLEVYDD